ncbi:DUF4249 domain-containing protein [Cytophagales bacterium LB-30]|uniref:DUF4249 domain-containing protein n=1 Tax=Shiella aurantiaca TaxID=3058365 RepID=A0ABT8F315_9BACT|nr:DUF4249 domain-containing protein [Shiella aurantiaca]MDN4164406.1 DUF4249 domain-containing protein [Shiella aurantiaca]
MKKYFIYSLLLATSFFSCEMVVDVDVPREPSKLVVNSLFSTDSVFSAEVYYSRYILDDTYPTHLINANVRVFEGDQLVCQLVFDESRNLFLPDRDARPEAGKTYRIEASHTNYQTAEATAIAQPIVPIESLHFTGQSIVRDYQTYHILEMTFTDLPGNQTYLLEMQQNIINYYVVGEDTVYDYYSYPNYIISDDPSVVTDENGGSVYVLDDSFDGKQYTLRLMVPDYSAYEYEGVRITNSINLKNISEEYYLFVRSYNNHTYNEGNPFAEPVSVYSNITNAYGIFAGFGEYRMELPSITTQGN